MVERGEEHLGTIPYEQSVSSTSPEPRRVHELPGTTTRPTHAPPKPPVPRIEQQFPVTGIQNHNPSVAHDGATPDVDERGRIIVSGAT